MDVDDEVDSPLKRRVHFAVGLGVLAAGYALALAAVHFLFMT